MPFRAGYIRLRADDTARIVKQARRRFRRPNAARRWVEGEVWAAMAANWRAGEATGRDVRAAVRHLPEIREAIGFHLESLREDGLPVPQPASQVEYIEIAA